MPGFQRPKEVVRIVWKSAAAWPLGYSRHSTQILLALKKLGAHIAYRFVYKDSIVSGHFEEPSKTGNQTIDEMKENVDDPEWPQIVCASADLFDRNTGKYKIGYATTEVNGIPDEWVRAANRMDEVWVLSAFNQTAFAKCGALRPIFIMPAGVDPDIFNPTVPAVPIDNAFVFLSIFEWAERKAPEILLRAFNAEFKRREDVILFFKILVPPWASFDVPAAVDDLHLSPTGGRVIIDLGTYLPARELGSLYRSADCFVLPTRGEGWGLPIYEAMACGLPVIATNWSAPSEYLSDQIAYPLRITRLVTAMDGKYPYCGYQWAEPDQEHLRHLMRHVYEHQAEAREKGRRASEFVLSSLTWQHAAARIMDRLADIHRHFDTPSAP